MLSTCLPTFSARHEALGLGTTSNGVTVTANASANVKGVAATVGTAGFDYRSFTVFINNGSSAADYTVDIIVDGTVLVPDLHYCSQRAADGGVAIWLPVYVRSGGVITAKTACATGGSTVSVSVTGSSNTLGGPSFSSVVALYTPASSRGVPLDPGGTANTDGSWTQLTAPAVRITGMFASFGGNGQQNRTGAMLWRVDIGVGLVATPPTVFLPGLHLSTDATDDVPRPQSAGPWACDLLASTPIAARCRCSLAAATTRLIDLALYGLVI